MLERLSGRCWAPAPNGLHLCLLCPGASHDRGAEQCETTVDEAAHGRAARRRNRLLKRFAASPGMPRRVASASRSGAPTVGSCCSTPLTTPSPGIAAAFGKVALGRGCRVEGVESLHCGLCRQSWELAPSRRQQQRGPPAAGAALGPRTARLASPGRKGVALCLDSLRREWPASPATRNAARSANCSASCRRLSRSGQRLSRPRFGRRPLQPGAAASGGYGCRPGAASRHVNRQRRAEASRAQSGSGGAEAQTRDHRSCRSRRDANGIAFAG